MSFILNEVRESIPVPVADPTIVDRSQLLTRNDLHNIKRDFGLFQGRYHRDDNQSVAILFERLEKQPGNPVRLNRQPSLQCSSSPKKGNEAKGLMIVLATDYQLKLMRERGNGGTICMDSTHGTAGYDYHLTTIMVIDEFGFGVPVAFCISSGASTIEWKDFLLAVKGANNDECISAQVLMTDNDPSFYNAWGEVMGAVEHRLLCAWHIDQCWRRNLGKASTLYILSIFAVKFIFVTFIFSLPDPR